jgi:small subunit ribosomal protein S20
MKNLIKAVDAAILEQSAEKAQEALKVAVPVIYRTAAKGTIHKKNASRKVSRLTKRVNLFLSGAQGEA